MKYTLGFIGTGNMGGAVLRAALKAVEPQKAVISNRTAEKSGALASELGCAAGTNSEAAGSRFVFLGVKPQMMGSMLEGIKDVLSQRKEHFVLVTMAAGLTMERIQEMAGGKYPVIRIMPNTPVSVGMGMTLCCASAGVTDKDIAEFKDIMRYSGRIDFIEEKLIDAASALSGCGPAFVYMFIEALSDGAMEYTCQTLIGSASLALESGMHPGALKDAVCSPGGSTIAGVHALEKNGFRNAAMDCVKAAYEKTKELGK